MATKADRGTKRWCQNSDCGARFYDLGRNPIVCPVCATPYELAAVAPVAATDKFRKPAAKPPEFVAADTEKPEAADEALAEIESSDEPVAAAGDATFLEEEEEEDAGGAVAGIVSGGEPDEER